MDHPTDSLTDFAPHVGSEFYIASSGGDTYTLELNAIADISLKDANRNPELRETPFRLTFRHQEKDRYLPQKTYRMTHPDLGELSLFLVPIGPNSDGMYYESIFN